MPTYAAVAGFDKVGDEYERGRPGYPPEAIEFLATELPLGPGTRVVELGAGTGKFTRTLSASGATIVPVEPTAGMRNVLHRLEPDRPIVAANAEQLPFRDGAADVVVAAQAFHWFASSEAMEEIVRILRPGGGLGLVWNTRDETEPWTAKLGALINAHDVATPKHRGLVWKKVVDARPDLAPLDHRAFAHTQRLDLPTLIDRVLSVSFIALLPKDEQAVVVRHVRAMLDDDPATRGRSHVDLPYRTDVYTTHRR